MSENNSNSRFMTVRQVAEYMQLNEKKICPRDRRKNSSDNGEFFRMIRGHCIFVNELLAQHSMKINDLSSTVKVFFQSRNRGTHSYRTVRRSYRNT